MSAKLPDPQTAYDTLLHGVHERVFFHKLAAAGLVPSTPEEAAAMLDTAFQLRMLRESPNVKQAAAENNPVFQMQTGLHSLMEQYGLRQQQHATDINIKHAAASFADDPVMYNAVLALKAAEAENAQAQLRA